MSETTPPNATVSNTKSLLLSKTLWLQLITILMGFYPPALAWLKSSPEDVVTLLVALNILVRFFTSTRIALFPPEDVEKTSGPAGGLSLLWITGMAAAVTGVGLPSCSPDQIAAARAIPIKACVITPEGKICYSDTDGLSAEIDARTSK